jgi:acyl dehydratase
VNVVVDKRTSASRPGWGILTARTTGTNQRGEDVYSITASAFVPTRAKG